jgi:hypothetical protein
MHRELFGAAALASCASLATPANAGARVFQLNGITIGIDDQDVGLASLSTQALGTINKAPYGEAGMVDIAYPVSE